MEQPNQQSQSPQPVNSTPPVINSDKSKLIPIILGIAAVVVIAIGAYLLGTTQSQPIAQNTISPTPSPSKASATKGIPSPTPVIDVTNWKVYSNINYGYSVRYPEDKFIDCGNEGLALYNTEDRKDCFPYGEGSPEFSIGIVKASYPKPYEKSYDENCYYVKKEIINVDGINATKFSNVFLKDIKTRECQKIEVGYAYNSVNIIIDYNNKIYGVYFNEKNDKEIKYQILSTFKFIEQPALPTACKDELEGTPVILSLSSNFGSVGTKLEIKGCNFSGFEGDKNAWIENSQGVRGILYGQEGSTSKLLKITLGSPLCQIDNSYSGIPCDKFLTLIPGVYKIYTIPWEKKSNELNFTIQ